MISGMATDQSPGPDNCDRRLYVAQLDTRLDNWMGDLPPHLYKAPLKNLAIPGTHDSGSFYLDKTSPLSPDEDKTTIKAIIGVLAAIDKDIDQKHPKFGHFLENLGKDVVYNFSITQDFCFTKQLNNGLRYFDLRVAWREDKKTKKTGSLYFVHGLYGSKVETAMTEIADWLNTHPKEVVLLDFNHFFNMDDHHGDLIDILKNTFSRMLCPKTIVSTPVDVNLAELWENSRQVIVFYNTVDNKVASTDTLLWSDQEYVESPWPNTPDINTLLDNFLPKKLSMRNESKFFVSQAILTPDTKTILWNLTGSLKSALATPVMPHVLTWLNGKTLESGMNIVIADFVDLEEVAFPRAVISLNYMYTLE